MNCCNAYGKCTLGFNCPAHSAPPIQRRSCDELGVCQGLGADQCPNCDHFECEVEVPCSPEPACPTYPFAPGVIEGPACPPLTRRALVVDLLVLFACSAAAGLVAGYLLERIQ